MSICVHFTKGHGEVALRINSRLWGEAMFDDSKIKGAVLKTEAGLGKYLEIMDLLHKVDVNTDRDFQRKYNHFYRVQRRSEEFYKRYYDLMEFHKQTGISFEESLTAIHRDLGRVEASFCSKLVATLNPDKPVWDQYILKNLKLQSPYHGDKNRLVKIVKIYKAIEDWYSVFLNTKDAEIIVQLFDETYGDVGVTNLKKIDLTLWQMRE